MAVPAARLAQVEQLRAAAGARARACCSGEAPGADPAGRVARDGRACGDGARLGSRYAARPPAGRASRPSAHTPRRRRGSAWPTRRGCPTSRSPARTAPSRATTGRAVRLEPRGSTSCLAGISIPLFTGGPPGEPGPGGAGAGRAGAGRVRATVLNALAGSGRRAGRRARGARPGCRASRRRRARCAARWSWPSCATRPACRATSMCWTRSAACSTPSWR